MTQEEKELLLKDLCARLPYGVKVHIIDATGAEIDDRLTTSTISHLDRWVVKPYLRPRNSVTKKELKEYDKIFNKALDMWEVMDWMNDHYLDYRDLIPKGLALEAPEGMYKEG